jgi:hypothetical protein
MGSSPPSARSAVSAHILRHAAAVAEFPFHVFHGGAAILVCAGYFTPPLGSGRTRWRWLRSPRLLVAHARIHDCHRTLPRQFEPADLADNPSGDFRALSNDFLIKTPTIHAQRTCPLTYMLDWPAPTTNIHDALCIGLGVGIV